jgi:hypothetical protein
MTKEHSRWSPTAADAYWRAVKDASRIDLLGFLALTLICGALLVLT